MTVIMTLLGTLLTSLVIAREYERGTLEALYATPLTRGQILVGKTLPYFVLAMISMAVCVLTALLLFKVPLRGSFLALGAVAAAFLVPSLGQGLLIMVRKELIAMLCAPRARMWLSGPPIIQLFIFSSAATMEVKNIALAIVDLDRGPYAAEVEQRLTGSRSFTHLPRYPSVAAARSALEREQVIGMLVLPNGLSADVAAARPATVQLLLDGRRSNAAQITAQYVSTIVAGISAGADAAPGGAAFGPPPKADVVIDNWFNPNLDYQWFMLPNLVGT